MLKGKLFILLVLFVLSACSSSKTAQISDKDPVLSEDKNAFVARLELIDHLRTKPGIDIRRWGNSWAILIRGHKSINGKNDPLFVMDGVPLGRDYELVSRSVDPMQIEDIEIIPASRAALYGSRGQNGIISITMKKG